jgi:hypothetical protein
MFFQKKWKVLSMCLILFVGMAISPLNALAENTNNKKGEFPSLSENSLFEEVKDFNYEIAIEIADSQLEEQTIVKSDGTLASGFKNSNDAKVSKEAFERYEQALKELNAQIQLGNISFGSNVFEMKVTEQYIEGENNLTKTYLISNSKANKAMKILTVAGGALGVVALVGGGFAVAVAAALVGLGVAVIAMCNFNDRGFVLITGASPMCVPG